MSGAEPTENRQRSSRRGGSAPTVEDVAKAANVSTMTVSRVVNNKARVLAATRDKVEDAIARLGYIPNPAARSLAGGRQCRIALLHSNPSAAYLSEFLVGSMNGAAAADAQLIVEPWNGGEDRAELLRRLTSHRIDAVLLPPPLCDDGDLIDCLSAAGLAMAQIATGCPSSRAEAVTICDEAAAQTMTCRLIRFGHTRIGFIIGDTNQTTSLLRLAGYKQGLMDAGIPIVEDMIAQGNFTYRSGLAAAEALLGLAPPPTAIFASNDDMAAAVIAVAHRRDMAIPDDLSVCGFDDSAMATTIWPEITTIRQPIAEMARRATILLAEAFQERRSAGYNPHHERLAFELIERASDGPLLDQEF